MSPIRDPDDYKDAQAERRERRRYYWEPERLEPIEYTCGVCVRRIGFDHAAAKAHTDECYRAFKAGEPRRASAHPEGLEPPRSRVSDG